ncbi:MAG TPA: insulinase family protein [Allosphingosinicella sp.]
MKLADRARTYCSALALTMAACPALAADPIAAEARIEADPAVTTGTFANGLRYAVKRNSIPSGAVSIRLVFRVGSYEEADSERGYAHFVEHMAFRSTRPAPEGSLDTRFSSLGVTFGRDQNATTDLLSTQYRMDLPKAQIGDVRTVLTWLRGAADGILFTPAAIDVERGVVLAEIKARNNPAASMSRELSLWQAPELRSAQRDPGGTEEALKGATPTSLQAFYDRWYRPENASLIIVGDAAPEELLKAAETAFADWKGRGPAGTRPAAPSKLSERGFEALARTAPALPAAASACRAAPLEGSREVSLERLRRELFSQIWATILTSRMSITAAKPGSPLLTGGPVVNHGLPDARISCLLLMPANGKWREALSTAQAELRRFGQSGPTSEEVQNAISQTRLRLHSLVEQSATRSSPAVADEIASAELAGHPFTRPEETLRIYEMLLAGVTADDILQRFKQDWSGSGPLLALNFPTPVTKEELAAAWNDNEKAEPLQAYAAQEAQEWQYRSFGKRGKVDSRHLMPEGFIRLIYKNGVVLNFKQTSFQSGAAEIRVRFGHGERGFSPAERTAGSLGASFLPLGGLGKMDFRQISAALGEGNWAFQTEVQATGFVLSSSAAVNAVPQQLMVFAAFLTDPAFGPMLDDKIPTSIDLIYRSYRSEPGIVAQEALEKALFPNHPSLPPREELARYRAADFARLLKPALTTSPIEVTVVGDVDEATVRQWVAATFGALPRRAPLAPLATEGPFRRFPRPLPAPVTATHEGTMDKAAAILMWPLYVAGPERRREEYAIGLLRSILEMRLLHQVRVVMGKVYSPEVANVMIDEADEGYISAALEATPGEIDALVVAARKVAADLAAGAITQEEVDAARTPLLAANQQALSRNEAWAGVLSHSYRNPDALFELTRFQSDLNALTLADVRRAAADWLAPAPMLARALPSAPAAASPR